MDAPRIVYLRSMKVMNTYITNTIKIHCEPFRLSCFMQWSYENVNFYKGKSQGYVLNVVYGARIHAKITIVDS